MPVDFKVNSTPIVLADFITVPLLAITKERVSVVGGFYCAYL
jgi:hypothetical protein